MQFFCVIFYIFLKIITKGLTRFTRANCLLLYVANEKHWSQINFVSLIWSGGRKRHHEKNRNPESPKGGRISNTGRPTMSQSSVRNRTIILGPGPGPPAKSIQRKLKKNFEKIKSVFYKVQKLNIYITLIAVRQCHNMNQSPNNGNNCGDMQQQNRNLSGKCFSLFFLV